MICFECGDNNCSLHEHHIIPRSLGGEKTVLICENCHGKIHGLDFTNHSILIKKGLEVARLKNTKLGRPKGKTSIDNMLKKHENIRTLLNNGISIRKTAKQLNVGISTVQRIKKLIK